MFINNKYSKLYFALIEKYGNSNLGEVHHIIPKSLGGKNNKENLIKIPTRVHFILHKLLCKMVNTPAHVKSMHYAIWQMMNRNISKFTSKDYEKVRKIISKHMSCSNPMYDTNIAQQFMHKRPEQSLVAKKRNEVYWKDRARPLLEKSCVVCNKSFSSRVPTHTCCCKSCSAKLSWTHRKNKC